MHIWHGGIAKLVGIRSGPNERGGDIIDFSLAADGDRFTPRNPDTAIGQQEAIDHEKDALRSIHSLRHLLMLPSGYERHTFETVRIFHKRGLA